MKGTFFRLALLTICAGQGHAQDTLKIDSGFLSRQVNAYFTYISLEQETTADSAWNLFGREPSLERHLDKINFGPVNGYFWLRTTLRNTTAEPQYLYLEVRQAHLYHLRFYSVTGNKPNLLYKTGIQYEFFTRPLAHRYFSFPITLNSGESLNVLLLVHHINSLTLPLYVHKASKLHERNYHYNLAWGYWLGFLSFCALFGLFASALLKNRVFLWYFLYISSAILFGFTELGYAFQFLFPSRAGLDAPAIIHTSIYPLLFLIKFSQGLLATGKHLPRMHTLLNIVFYFLLVMIIAGVIMTELMFRISYFILPVVNLAIVAGTLALAYCGIKALFINRMVAIFYLVAYLTLVSATIFVMMNFALGWYQYSGPNPILLAYFFEAVLLSIALVILYRQIQTEKTILLQKVSAQQKEMYQQYIDGVEKERSRIAGELHDDIGSKLSYLQRLLSRDEVSSHAHAQLESIASDIRKLSHDLAPPLAQVMGLVPMIEKLIAETKTITNLDIKLQTHNFEHELKPEEIQQVYRIVQEAMNNMVKHAKATRADIQIFGYDDEIVITIDDNGEGFDPHHEGLGLSQMKVRTASLGGTINIQSRPGMGCHIMIHLPAGKQPKH